MTIALFDPSIASTNLGDQIILDAVYCELTDLLPREQVITVPTQEVISPISIQRAKLATHRLVGGTNLLSARMGQYKQWQITLRQSLSLHDVTLMGVGWWQYQDEPDLYTRTILRNVLSRQKPHSVRDEYTRKKLLSIGIENVLNTGCPTMWRLTPEHCTRIPACKADAVVLTLTDYHADPVSDVRLIDSLRKHYATIYFWPQGSGDMDYFRSLQRPSIEVLQPRLAAYDELLRTAATLDFVGTRLHGGVRAMQHLRRALVLAVDNRAREISADTGLPIAARGDLLAVEKWINHPSPTAILMNWPAISEWKSQFIN
jgi:polysaccharide pyruvyl transferase WcaK-like protein